MPTAIRLVKLEKRFRTKYAVKEVNLTVNKGELFCFLGPNGSGKTTTIKMMTGLLEPTAGFVELVGMDIAKKPIEVKKKMAYVPDQPLIYPKLTGREYLEFIASVFEVEDELFEQRMNHYTELFSLKGRLDEYAGDYSHGMKQKLSLCAALIHKPEILFLDEPTVGLDPKSAKILKSLLRQLCDDGMTVFMSTHILEIAEQMCDRVGIIKDGQLITVASMDELKKERGNDSTLEDIFLDLTGDAESQLLVSSMKEEEV
ncbi:ABC transporter [Alkalihalobacillus alcalophilus ATCC 27647 = CGMCC 1.3604]|nr:ABC transporter ATP-binding protein [Alkalihalobacillus alcalophilus]KGA98814.1 ABC transporter [Alkalihalobacillus alcalophilus ATCC 27647 = CGMCC 1.3604]MED1560997.1 ABC transporter ATP-binding protein [Alkalihalobacillus alcalophilus]THG91557.1 ABC transporter [Alkalihalobacillus alcalophilus ATCC 27647 = CGMCC 1.3604]